jgi:hypothetical protein
LHFVTVYSKELAVFPEKVAEKILTFIKNGSPKDDSLHLCTLVAALHIWSRDVGIYDRFGLIENRSGLRAKPNGLIMRSSGFINRISTTLKSGEFSDYM